MEEKLDKILNEISNVKVEIKDLKTRIGMVEKRLNSQGKQINSQGKQMTEGFKTLDKKIDDTAIDLRAEIFKLRDELKLEIKDSNEINTRQYHMLNEHFEKLYQESRNDRQELHQSIDILSNAFQFNKMEIEKLATKC